MFFLSIKKRKRTQPAQKESSDAAKKKKSAPETPVI
jgi:hypothetical protein